MLRFTDPAAAVLAALDIVDGAKEAGLPPARAGTATGAVVLRDGDCFGRTVNQAARLVDATGPGTAPTTAYVARSAATVSEGGDPGAQGARKTGTDLPGGEGLIRAIRGSSAVAPTPRGCTRPSPECHLRAGS